MVMRHAGGLCLVLQSEVCAPTLYQCMPGGARVRRRCVKAGDTPYGGECEVSSDCASGVCVFLAYSYGTCTQYCGQNGGLCPGGHQCLQDAVCVPPGDGLIGQPCYAGVQCQTTYCEEGVCTQPCGAGVPCPAPTTCGASGFCEGIQTGGGCDDASDCPDGLSCQKDANGQPGTCQRACEPLADTGCTGQIVWWRWSLGTFLEHMRPKQRWRRGRRLRRQHPLQAGLRLRDRKALHAIGTASYSPLTGLLYRRNVIHRR